MNAMLLDADYLFNEAIMTNKFFIVVEGENDPYIFENLCNEIETAKTIEILPVEIIKNTGGCSIIKELCEEIVAINTKKEIRSYLMCIVDRDTREYRNEMILYDFAFTLKYYSIESHYINETTVAKFIELYTNKNICSCDAPHILEFMDLYFNRLDKYRLVTYDAIKNAIEKDYKNTVSYSDNFGKIFNDAILEECRKKELELLAIEKKFAIEKTEEHLLRLYKGKWVLCDFVNQIILHNEYFRAKCYQSENKCIYCKSGKPTKCVYNIKSKNIKEKDVAPVLRKYVSNAKFGYIIDEIKSRVN